MQRGDPLEAIQPRRVRNGDGTLSPAAQASTVVSKKYGLFPWKEPGWGAERAAWL